MSRIVFTFDADEFESGHPPLPGHLRTLYEARSQRYGASSVAVEYGGEKGTLSYAVVVGAPRERRQPENELLQEAVESAMGSDFGLLLGIAVKARTAGGMSSRLMKRSQEFALNRRVGRGDTDYLPGERAYEQERHALDVFYQVLDFVDTPPEYQTLAFPEMWDLRFIEDRNARQALAEEHPVFGIQKGDNHVILNPMRSSRGPNPSAYLWGPPEHPLVVDGEVVASRLFPGDEIAVQHHPPGTTYRVTVAGRVDVFFPENEG